MADHMSKEISYYPSYSYPNHIFYPHLQPQQLSEQQLQYLQVLRQQQLLLWIQRQRESDEEWEQLQQKIDDFVNPTMEMEDPCLVSFLEVDDSFLTPWSWNPDAPVDHASSSSSRKKYMTIVPGSFFSADNPTFLSKKDEKSENLRGIDDAEQVSDGLLDQSLPRTDVEQVSDGLLDQNLPRTEVPGNLLDKKLLLKTDVEQVSEDFLNRNNRRKPKQRPKQR